MKRKVMSVLIVLATAATALSANKEHAWNFDHDRTGIIGSGFYGSTGSWKVRADATAPSKPNVLAQLAKSSRETCNTALVVGSSYRNLDMSVKIRAIDGALEQGGGVILRAKNSRNYYVVCYNPLDGNFRLYRVVNNGRVELGSATIMNVPGWHTLRVVLSDDHFICYFDGTMYLDRRDAAYKDAGQVGLWTRADAQTYFDDLTVAAK